MEEGDVAAVGRAGGSSSAAEDEEYSWVPVRVARLANLLHHLSAVQQSRWLDRRGERGWVAAAAAMGPDADADADAERERQLKLARDLCDVMSTSWYGYSCALHEMAENVAEAVDAALRPRPESAAWWRFGYVHDDVLRGSHGFVHLPRGQAARAQGLVADAVARTRRIRAQVELKRLVALVARMRRAERRPPPAAGAQAPRRPPDGGQQQQPPRQRREGETEIRATVAADTCNGTHAQAQRKHLVAAAYLHQLIIIYSPVIPYKKLGELPVEFG